MSVDRGLLQLQGYTGNHSWLFGIAHFFRLTSVAFFRDIFGYGRGKYAVLAGGWYEGPYKNGQPNGQGCFTNGHGTTFIGSFKDEQFDDVHVTATRTNGDIFTGLVKGGRAFNGQGTFTFPSGAKYKGPVENGAFHGEGTYIFKNGDEHKGPFKNGKSHGIFISVNSINCTEKITYIQCSIYLSHLCIQFAR